MAACDLSTPEVSLWSLPLRSWNIHTISFPFSERLLLYVRASPVSERKLREGIVKLRQCNGTTTLRSRHQNDPRRAPRIAYAAPMVRGRCWSICCGLVRRWWWRLHRNGDLCSTRLIDGGTPVHGGGSRVRRVCLRGLRSRLWITPCRCVCGDARNQTGPAAIVRQTDSTILQRRIRMPPPCGVRKVQFHAAG